MADDRDDDRLNFVRPDPTKPITFNRPTNQDGSPIRDKTNDNPRHEPKQVRRPAPNLAPGGSMGIRTPNMPNERILPSKPTPSVVIEDGLRTDTAAYVNGRLPSMPGHSFWARVNDQPSLTGVDQGRIEQLVISKDDKPVCRYNHGWEVEPQNAKDREAVHRVRQALDDRPKEQFKGFEPPKDKDRGMDR